MLYKGNTMLRLLTVLTLSIFSCLLHAKTVSPGNYTSMAPEFRGSDQESARKVLLKEINRVKALSARRPQIIVLPFKVDAVQTVKAEGGSVSAQNALKKQLIKGGAQVVDRSLPSKVSAELEYIESTGMSRGVNFDLADYLFGGEVLDASNGNNYTGASSYTTKEGKRVNVPAKCVMSGYATVAMHFYTMNPLALKKSMVLEGAASSEVLNVSSANCASRSIKGLQVAAVSNAFAKKDDELKDLFSPTGWVIDRRFHKKKGKPEKGKNMIFKTSLQSRINAANNTKVIVYQVAEQVDPLTGEIQREKAKIGVGEIIETLGDNSVWIKMDKSKEAAIIRLGDVVEINNAIVCARFDLKCMAARGLRSK
ncbi:MAG: hypothetical protein ACI93R_000417 [Flavobacteriales bacterium]|jgi:hypothetical protein